MELATVLSWRLGRQLGGGGRWFRASAAILSGRAPLISFPQRRQPNGQPLVQLSLEPFQQDQSSVAVTSQTLASQTRHSDSISVELPAMFGRLPLSPEEVELINSGGAR